MRRSDIALALRFPAYWPASVFDYVPSSGTIILHCNCKIFYFNVASLQLSPSCIASLLNCFTAGNAEDADGCSLSNTSKKIDKK